MIKSGGKLFPIIVFFCIFLQAKLDLNAQCSGIEIHGIKGDGPDTILLYTTQSISIGTSFYLSDNEWSSANQNFADLNEGEVTWTATSDIPSGTNIYLYALGVSDNITESSLGSLTGAGLNIATGGDVVYILNVPPSTTIGSNTNANFCFAVGLASTTSNGDIPTNGLHVGNFDNVNYLGSGDILLASNWEGNDDPIQISLPVMLSKINLVINKISTLSWSTLSETNNSHFIVEHSTDGKTWNEVGRVEAQLNRSNEKDYSFEHHQPAHGINYYRLNQFDLDGTKTTFDVLAGFFKGSEETFLFPTIAEDAVYISGETKGKLQMIDAQGRMIQQMNYQSGNPIPTTNLSSGQYFLKLEDRTFTFFKP